jgi:hypothetical protein
LGGREAYWGLAGIDINKIFGDDGIITVCPVVRRTGHFHGGDDCKDERNEKLYAEELKGKTVGFLYDWLAIKTSETVSVHDGQVKGCEGRAVQGIMIAIEKSELEACCTYWQAMITAARLSRSWCTINRRLAYYQEQSLSMLFLVALIALAALSSTAQSPESSVLSASLVTTPSGASISASPIAPTTSFANLTTTDAQGSTIVTSIPITVIQSTTPTATSSTPYPSLQGYPTCGASFTPYRK